MSLFTYGLAFILALKCAVCYASILSPRDLPPLPPPPSGCIKYAQDSNCVVDVFCTGYIEDSLGSFAITSRNYYNQQPYIDQNYNDDENDGMPGANMYECSDYISYGPGAYSKVHLRYKNGPFQNSESEIPQIQNINSNWQPQSQVSWLPIIDRLDLSNNDYNVVPNLKEMQNLVSLNLSSNYLTIARLFNPNYELKALNAIDMSFNTISSIEVDLSQHPYKNLKSLNLSHNYLVEIPDSILDVFTKLETLDLSHNFVDTLDISTFEGIKKVTGLFLSHNRISDINYSLFRFSELVTLDLSHNRIGHLKSTDFEKLTQLKTIDLSSNSIVTIETCTFCNMNGLILVNLHDNKLSTVSRETFANASQLQKVDISYNKFDVLPRGLFKNKRIREFVVNGNNLKGSLVKGMFEGLELVTKLDLSHESITTLDDNAFIGLNNVKVLLLNYNQINFMSNNCFRGLYNLNTLDLSDNNITDLNFDVTDLVHINSIVLKNNHLTRVTNKNFQGLSSLQFLDLRNNKITNFESNSFHSLRDLINFEISNNPLNGTLAERTFDGLNSLPSLGLSATQLTAINNGSFIGMTQLKDLNVSHSQINELQYNAFIQTGAIEILDLSYNQLKTFDINATDLVNVKILKLNENLLTSITKTSFVGLLHLNNINLAHNRIINVHNDAFIEQTDLSQLDLSYNTEIKFNVSFMSNNKNLNKLCLSGIKNSIQFTPLESEQMSNLEISYSGLTNISELNLRVLTRLENLVLNNNEISKVEVGSFTNMSQLTQLDISHNKIFFIQPGVFKDNIRLVTLNISHNSLTTISYGIFRGLIYLSTLDMSYNNINSLESERFYEIRSLNTLIVDHNKIDSINIEEFAGTSLSTLSIGENPLPCELLVNFKRNRHPFEITAITLNEHIGENVDGVTCNMNGFTYKKKTNDSHSGESEKLLIDIRELLIKIASKNISTPQPISHNNDVKYISNITEQIDKSTDKYIANLSILLNSTSVLVAKSSNTNLLLGKILNVLSKKPQTNTTPFPKLENNSSDELIAYINKMKEELESTIAAEKENILIEVEKKVSILKSEVHTPTITPKAPVQDKLLANNEPIENEKSSVFTETCVALILVILVCLVLYKFYKSRMFVRARRSYSTRELPGAMESPNL